MGLVTVEVSDRDPTRVLRRKIVSQRGKGDWSPSLRPLDEWWEPVYHEISETDRKSPPKHRVKTVRVSRA